MKTRLAAYKSIVLWALLLINVNSFAESISKGNVTLTLDRNRGAQVGSIFIAGQGETIVNDFDGRGM